MQKITLTQKQLEEYRKKQYWRGFIVATYLGFMIRVIYVAIIHLIK